MKIEKSLFGSLRSIGDEKTELLKDSQTIEGRVGLFVYYVINVQ